MKKEIRIVGLEHKTGVGKNTQKPYDFYVLHAIYPSEGTEGFACLSAVCPDVEVSSIKIDETVTLFSHFYGGREVIDAILR